MTPRARIARLSLRPNGPLVEDADRVRTLPGAFNDDGEFVEGAETVEPVKLITAPIQDEDREILPAGLQSIASRLFWTFADVQGVNDDADSDILRYAGLDYRAARIQNWGGFLEIVGVQST